MKSKSILLAIVVLALLALFVGRELQRDKDEGVLRTSDVVFPYATYRVQSFEFHLDQDPGGWARFERRKGEGWVLMEGSEGADVTFAPDLLSAWSRIRFIEDVDEGPTEEDLGRYGLAPPVVTLEAELAGEGEKPEHTARLEIGEPSPLKPAYYARIDGFERVVLVSADAGDFLSGAGLDVLGLERPPSKTKSESEQPRP